MYRSPQPKAHPFPRLRRFWKSKTGIGCLVVMGLLFTVIVYGAIIGGGNSESATTATPTATQMVTLIQLTHVPTPSVTAIATQIPTVVVLPKPTPTIKPTATSVPTATRPPAPTATSKPTPPLPTPTPCPGINCNPFGYNFSPGNLITNPPSAFCNYFACIPNFYNGSGYVVECQDSQYSLSGGVSGACSHHGGVLRPLYSH